jgi:hypothetical protein
MCVFVVLLETAETTYPRPRAYEQRSEKKGEGHRGAGGRNKKKEGAFLGGSGHTV